jgi:hypothetical protein
LTVAGTADLDEAGFLSASAGWLCDLPKKFHFRGDRVRLVSFLVATGLDAPEAEPWRPLKGSERESRVDSSDMTLVSTLYVEGETTLGRAAAVWLYILCDWLLAMAVWLSFWMDLLKARVDFIASASESLLSEGRRLPKDGALGAVLGNADGQRVCRGAPSLEDMETCELFLDPRLGGAQA